MSNLKYYVEAKQIGNMDIGVTSYKGKINKYKCAYCGEQFFSSINQIDYKVKSYHFCSWTCKCRWRRENDES